MTDDTMPLLDALLKRGGGDALKDLAEEVSGRLMAYDVDWQIGAGRYERSEQLSKEVKRRADVVGIFPDEDAIKRLVGAILLE